jgi:ABC-type sugar transport system ATPase subunit
VQLQRHDDLVGDLSIAKKQMVEIARALTVDPKAVIFDEPTASLTDPRRSCSST